MQDLSVDADGEVYIPNREGRRYTNKRLKTMKRDMLNTALWDAFIGMGFLLSIIMKFKALKLLIQDMPAVVAWSCTSEAFYFVASLTEYLTYLVVKDTTKIKKVRICLDIC